jgi:hypothetical protein
VLDQLAAPLGVLDVALAAGHVTQVTGVVEPALELVFEQVVDRAPVDAGGLHPDDRHREAAKPIGQHQQPGGRRLKLADLLPAPAVAVGYPHARGHLRLVDVEHRATLDQPIHGTSQESDDGRPAGRASCGGV